MHPKSYPSLPFGIHSMYFPWCANCEILIGVGWYSSFIVAVRSRDPGLFASEQTNGLIATAWYEDINCFSSTRFLFSCRKQN